MTDTNMITLHQAPAFFTWTPQFFTRKPDVPY